MDQQNHGTMNEFGEGGGFTITQGKGALTPADPAYDPHEAEKGVYDRLSKTMQILFRSGGRMGELELTRFEAETLCEALDTFLATTK